MAVPSRPVRAESFGPTTIGEYGGPSIARERVPSSPGALDIHKDVGKPVHLCYVLTFVAALIRFWPDWRRVRWPFALAVIGSLQAFLAGGDTSPWVHAFHAALVPIVFVIAVRIALRTKRLGFELAFS